jgi:hypothetical protein
VTKLVSLGEAMWRTRSATSRPGMEDTAWSVSALHEGKVEIARFAGAPTAAVRPRISVIGPVTL